MKRIYIAALAALLAPWAALAQDTPPPAATETAAPAETSAPAATLDLAALAGLHIQVEFVTELSSTTSTIGQMVELRLAEPISVNGQVLAPAGASGVGEVVDVNPNGMQGMPGLLVVSGRHLEVDGQRVPLEGMIFASTGRSRAGASGVAVAFIGPAAVFMRGNEVQVPAGTRTTARIAGGAPEVAAAIAGQNPVAAPEAGYGQLVIFRPTQNYGWPYTYGVADGEQTLAELTNGSYTIVPVNPGVHELAIIQPFGGRRSEATLRLEVVAGQRLFIHHGLMILTPSDEEAFAARRMRAHNWGDRD